jgi:hypothetical protein
MAENENMTLREALAANWDDVVGETPAQEEVAVEETQVETPAETTAEQNVQEEPTAQPVQEQPAQQQVHNPEVNPYQAQMEQQMEQLMEVIRQQQGMLDRLTQQNQQTGQALQQQSALAEEAVNRTMEPEPYPVFDFDAVRYLDAEAQNKAMMQWQQEMMARMAKDAAAQAMEQMKPIREQYETNRRMAEDDAARTMVFGDKRFSDFAGHKDSIERVIASTPALQGLSPVDKWIIGGLMDRGMRHASAPTAEEILTMAKANPDVMKAIAAQQATEMAQAQAGVPKIAPSSGMAQAQAIPENRPTTVKEMRDNIRKAFGL